MGRYRMELIEDADRLSTGMYRIIGPYGEHLPLRPLFQKDAESIVDVLNLMLDPDR